MVRVKPYYQDDFVTLYHGDCREIAPHLSADLLLTDPPYGINVAANMAATSGQRSGRGAALKGRYEHGTWDEAPPPRWVLEMLCSRTAQQIIWGGNYFDLPPARGWLVWDKENGDTKFADCELAWTSLDIAVRMKRHLWNGMLRKGGEPRFNHPAQKPLDVMMWCITLAASPETVLDAYAGSGTILIAAKNLGCKAIGIELSEAHCATIATRLSQEVLDLGGAA